MIRLALILFLVAFAARAEEDVVHAPGVVVQDEGTPQGRARTLNCTGAGVACSVLAGVATVDVSGGGGGAPTTATYITQTADATLSNEQALGALGTGILKSTTTTGVLSIAVAADIPTPVASSTVANGIASATTTVNTSAATAPTSGQALVATGSTTATWQWQPTFGRITGDVATTDAVAWTTAISYTPPASKSVFVTFNLIVSSSATANGVQLRPNTSEAGTIGSCVFWQPGISGTATSATAQEADIIAITSASGETAAAAANATTRFPWRVDCAFASDASPTAVNIQVQAETGGSTATIHAGSSYTATTD